MVNFRVDAAEPFSNCTRMPVSTGRDSSREAARATRPAVSRNASRSTLKTPSLAISGSRGKSSVVETLSRYDAAPQERLTILEPLTCSIFTSLSPLGSERQASTNTLPGTCLLYTSDAADDLLCVD